MHAKIEDMKSSDGSDGFHGTNQPASKVVHKTPSQLIDGTAKQYFSVISTSIEQKMTGDGSKSKGVPYDDALAGAKKEVGEMKFPLPEGLSEGFSKQIGDGLNGYIWGEFTNSTNPNCMKKQFAEAKQRQEAKADAQPKAGLFNRKKAPVESVMQDKDYQFYIDSKSKDTLMQVPGINELNIAYNAREHIQKADPAKAKKEEFKNPQTPEDTFQAKLSTDAVTSAEQRLWTGITKQFGNKGGLEVFNETPLAYAGGIKTDDKGMPLDPKQLSTQSRQEQNADNIRHFGQLMDTGLAVGVLRDPDNQHYTKERAQQTSADLQQMQSQKKEGNYLNFQDKNKVQQLADSPEAKEAMKDLKSAIKEDKSTVGRRDSFNADMKTTGLEK